MIKGTNKNVIEISETGHDCFERAILFLRPGRDGDNEQVKAKAGEFLSGLKLRRMMLRRGLLPLGAKLLAAAAAGAGVAAALLIR